MVYCIDWTEHPIDSIQVVYVREEGGEQQEVTANENETLEILAAGNVIDT